MKEIKCVVAGVNAQGEADFFFVKVKCTDEEFDLGIHYDVAEAYAEENDFEPKLCYDEVESPEGFMDLFVWESADVIDTTKYLAPSGNTI